MDMKMAVPMTLAIDGMRILNYTDIIKKCDGRQHIVSVTFDKARKWTHFEIQIRISNEKSYFEFPRLSSSSDTAVMDPTDPFQIVLSPNIPKLKELDIITESMFGRALMVMNINDWNTRQRNVLGYECQVRVVQPQEIYQILPRRQPVKTKNEATLIARDNVTGPYRT